MFDRGLIALRGLLTPIAADREACAAYERDVEQFFGQGTAIAFWKGRVALYAILRALGVGPGDEVIVPGYTCVMVPGPVLYVGATPVYVDIDPQTYVAPAESVLAALTPRTRVVLVQHTYGLPAPVAEIAATLTARGIAVIEDCCHVFGGHVAGRKLGTFGTAAFFSGQWNKPFSTGLGGLALVHDAALAERARQEQARCAPPTTKAAFMLAAQLLVYEALIYPRTTALATSAFRWLTRRGLVVGSSSAAEFAPEMPADYARGPARVQCALGVREVARAARNCAARSAATRRYLAALPALGYGVPPLADPDATPLLRFPVRVANKAEAVTAAAQHGVEIGTWFECPLHPSETDHAAFGYRAGQCPAAEAAAAEVINLPTHRRVGDGDIARTLQFLDRVCRPVR